MKPLGSPRPPFRGGGPRERAPKRDGGLRVNREIFASQVRVVDEEGKMLGVYSLHEALSLAEGRGLDLIEIAPNVQPPTCKIMDYGKYKYENKKKAVQARKNQVIIDIKEIQLRPGTEQHDIDTKVRHARRFFIDGDKVKVNLRFSGREMAYQDRGIEVLNKFADSVRDLALVESPPKKEGRQVFILLAPDPVKIKDYKKTHGENADGTEVTLAPSVASGPAPRIVAASSATGASAASPTAGTTAAAPAAPAATADAPKTSGADSE